MKNRYDKFVLEAEKGITFEVSEGTSGELIIRALNIATANVYSENYVNPPIPEGYKYVCGEWNNGFVIERSSDGSQFVWIPVGSLDSDGTLDGEHFSEKFGRRNYQDDEFSDSKFNEALNGELLEQLESVKKYGGFYISRYNISKSSVGKPQSVKGVMPWVNIKFDDAKKVASTIEDNEAVKSHLTFGAENDSVLAWFIKSNARTRSEIAEDSTNWGNHWNTKNSPRKVVETGSSEEWCTNNIYDFAGNVDEWTQEKNGSSCRAIRGGISTLMETIILPAIAVSSILITAMTALVFVPRFISSSTDHCKSILICFQTQIGGENFEISESLFPFLRGVNMEMEKDKDNRLVIIVKIEKYIEYMLTILLKLPRTEKFSIGTEVKTSMYEMLKNILLASKIDKNKRLQIYNIVDSNIYYQRICIRIMYNQKWIDEKKYKYSNELLAEIGKILGGLIKSLEVKKYAQNN